MLPEYPNDKMYDYGEIYALINKKTRKTYMDKLKNMWTVYGHMELMDDG
jgi:hypothetical protein